LENVKEGTLTIDKAFNQLRDLPFEDVGFAKIDHHRQLRTGYPEVIYCPGKTTDQIIRIVEMIQKRVIISWLPGHPMRFILRWQKYFPLRYTMKLPGPLLLNRKKYHLPKHIFAW